MSKPRVCVKICGVKQAADVIAAARAGADAVGLNFFPPSPRYIGSLAKAARLLKAAAWPRKLLWAGVFVNPQIAEVLSAVETLALDIVQLHGEESPDWVAALKKQLSGKAIWKAVRVSKKRDLAVLAEYHCDAWLIDAKAAKKRGGTGKTFDWAILKDMQRPVPLVLSGGLNPHNVAAAIRAVKPDWVDVASGVESSPGVKDAKLIDAFVRAARG